MSKNIAKVCGKEVPYDEGMMPNGRVILPLFNKVLIRKDDAPEKKGVIWIPPTVRDSQPVLSGTIVAVGPDVKYLLPGDYVVFSQYSGSQIKVDGQTYTAMKEEDVHVIIRSIM